MKKVFLVIFFTAIIAQMGESQSPGISKEFQKEIDGYLTFSIPIIKVKELSNNLEKYILLDAREEEEYIVSHIPGAHFIGYNHFKLKELEDIDKSKPVVVYCSIGYRSEKVAEILKKAGFEKIYNLYGSIFAWANAGMTLESQSGNTTNRIHGYNEDWSRWISGKNLNIVY